MYTFFTLKMLPRSPMCTFCILKESDVYIFYIQDAPEEPDV